VTRKLAPEWRNPKTARRRGVSLVGGYHAPQPLKGTTKERHANEELNAGCLGEGTGKALRDTLDIRPERV
jgi:hypothetical protein